MSETASSLACIAGVALLAAVSGAATADQSLADVATDEMLDAIEALGEVDPDTGNLLLDSAALAAAFPDLARSRAPVVEDARIVVHAGSFEQPDIRWVPDWIANTEVGPVVVREIGFDVRRHQVRYYHLDDAIAAWQVATELSNRLDAVTVRDFTHYRPSPSPGLVEVWLARSGT